MNLFRLHCILSVGALAMLAACGGSGAKSGSDEPQPPGGPLTTPRLIELEWLPSAAPDVTTYIIYHGAQPGVYDDSVAVQATTARYTVSTAGMHYFSVTALDSRGNESERSDEASVAVAP
jgi:hypothetical protein